MAKADNATRDSVKKEMAKPRMSKSARIAELNMDTLRTPGFPQYHNAQKRRQNYSVTVKLTGKGANYC
jgi:hypothetical protein